MGDLALPCGGVDEGEIPSSLSYLITFSRQRPHPPVMGADEVPLLPTCCSPPHPGPCALPGEQNKALEMWVSQPQGLEHGRAGPKTCLLCSDMGEGEVSNLSPLANNCGQES